MVRFGKTSYVQSRPLLGQSANASGIVLIVAAAGIRWCVIGRHGDNSTLARKRRIDRHLGLQPVKGGLGGLAVPVLKHTYTWTTRRESCSVDPRYVGVPSGDYLETYGMGG